MEQGPVDPDRADPCDPSPLRYTRTEMALARKAAREKWGVPDAIRTEVIYAMVTVLADPDAGRKSKIAAARTLAVLDQIDQNEDKLALARSEQREIPTAADAIRDMVDAGERCEDRDTAGVSEVPEPTGPIQ